MVSVAAVDMGGRTIDAARLEALGVRSGIIELAMFGSVARGDTTPASDVDVLEVLRPDALDDGLAGLFGRSVDLVARKAVHPLLRTAIEEQAQVVYAA